MKTPQTYRFHLGRNIRHTIGNPNMFFTITSTHTVELVTEDPDRTRHVILKNFPGWFVICHEIVPQNVAIGPEAGRADDNNNVSAGPGHDVRDMFFKSIFHQRPTISKVDEKWSADDQAKWSADDEKWQSEDPRR